MIYIDRKFKKKSLGLITKLWDGAKKLLMSFGAIALIVIGIAIGKISSCSEEEKKESAPAPSETNEGIDFALKQDYEKLKTENSKLKEILRLKEKGIAKGMYGKPTTDPFAGARKEIVYVDTSKTDTTHSYHYWGMAIDVPISLVVTKSSIRIMTRNDLNALRDEPFVKQYTYERKTKDFWFYLNETTEYSKLEGITLGFERRAFDWDGFGILAGWDGSSYLGVDARFILWEKMELSGRLTSLPGLGVEARWRL